MNDGAWIHSQTHRFAWVDEHAPWLQKQGNAASLGVPEEVIAKIQAVHSIRANPCRAAVLILGMDAGLIRFRGDEAGCKLDSTQGWSDILLGAESFLRAFADPELSVGIHDLASDQRLHATWRILLGALDQGNLEALRPLIRLGFSCAGADTEFPDTFESSNLEPDMEKKPAAPDNRAGDPRPESVHPESAEEDYESAFGDLEGHWYTVFSLYHRHTYGVIETFNLEDPALQGSNPLTSEDLDRVIARTKELGTWIGQFESASGNPFSVIATVASWPEGDAQSHPRLVTTYWLGPGIRDLEEMREAALELMERFQKAPLTCPVIKDIEYWELANRELFFDPTE